MECNPEKVTVTGNTLVSGGGVDSVVIIDTDLGTVEIEVPDGSPVRFAARGSSSVSSILVMTDAVLDTTGSEECIETTIIALPEGASVTMKGDFSTVEIENPECTVTVDEGTIRPVGNSLHRQRHCPGAGGKSPGEFLSVMLPPQLKAEGVLTQL